MQEINLFRYVTKNADFAMSNNCRKSAKYFFITHINCIYYSFADISCDITMGNYKLLYTIIGIFCGFWSLTVIATSTKPHSIKLRKLQKQ